MYVWPFVNYCIFQIPVCAGAIGILSMMVPVTDHVLCPKQTYFPAFKACVEEGNAGSIMCSYNAVNGVPSCANDLIQNNITRDQWGFEGYFVGGAPRHARMFVRTRTHAWMPHTCMCVHACMPKLWMCVYVCMILTYRWCRFLHLVAIRDNCRDDCRA